MTSKSPVASDISSFGISWFVHIWDVVAGPGEKQPGRTSADCRHWVERGQPKEELTGDWQRQNKSRLQGGGLARHFLTCEYPFLPDTWQRQTSCTQVFSALLNWDHSAGCERSCDFQMKRSTKPDAVTFGQWGQWCSKIWVVLRGERTEEWSLRTQDGIGDKTQQQGLSHKVKHLFETNNCCIRHLTILKELLLELTRASGDVGALQQMINVATQYMDYFMTDFKLMLAQQSGKGPNLKVVKWW